MLTSDLHIGLDVDIGQLTSIFSTTQGSGESKEPGMLKELWSGLVGKFLLTFSNSAIMKILPIVKQSVAYKITTKAY